LFAIVYRKYAGFTGQPMTKGSPLFRQAALDAQHNVSFGRIVLIRPTSFAFLTGFSLVCACAIVAFLVLGQYTKRARVVGLLVPDAGLIKVTTPVAGLVLEQHVQEGQAVKAGQVLFVLSAERHLSKTNGDAISASTALDNALRSRQQSLDTEQHKQALLTEQQRKQTQARLRSLQTEAAQLEQQLLTQRERVASSTTQLRRWQDLAAQKYASDLALQQRQDEWLDQRSRLQALEQSRLQLSRDEASLTSDLAQISTRAAREQEQLKRAASELDQARINLQTQRSIIITAPISGTATTVLAEVGQTANTLTLMSIVPEAAQLQAHLFAPSGAVGFVEAGQTVRLRYAGYPYQKFGQYEGQVVAVSRSPLTSPELPSALANLGQQMAGEGLYRITVKLANQSVNTYGKLQALSAGMQLEADVLQDTRRVLEWMFEPVLSVRGKL
jgi:membrane fusion protein